MYDNDESPDEQDREPQWPHASAPQSTAHEGLHVAKVTDLRDFDDWTNDEGFCQLLLVDRPSTWRAAIQRYWRDRCTRRELASELGVDLETAKNLLRRIRKAARDERSGQRKKVSSDGDTNCQPPRQCHSKITAADIYAICDGDEDAVAHMEEYGRLNTIEQLKLFSPVISGDLIQTFEHFEAIGDSQHEDFTSRLVAKAEKLKAKVVKPDPFMDLPVTVIFADYCTSMRIPETDTNGVTRWKVRLIGRSEAEPIKRGRPRQPRKETKPAAEITSPRNIGRFFMNDEMKKQYNNLTRSEVIRFVRDNELVKQDLAAIANVPAARLSDYLHDKPVSEEYADRIENAVANIMYVWTTFAPIKIALDDADAFWKAVELADNTHAAQSAWEGMEAGLRMKQEFNANEAAAD